MPWWLVPALIVVADIALCLFIGAFIAFGGAGEDNHYDQLDLELYEFLRDR